MNFEDMLKYRDHVMTENDDSSNWDIETVLEEIKKRDYKSELPSWLESSDILSEDDLSKTLNLLFYFINFKGPFSVDKIIESSTDELPEANPNLDLLPVYEDVDNLTALNRLKSDKDHLIAKEEKLQEKIDKLKYKYSEILNKIGTVERSALEKEKKWKQEKENLQRTWKDKESSLEAEIRQLKKENQEQKLKLHAMSGTTKRVKRKEGS